MIKHKAVTKFFAASDLVSCTEPHYSWKCPECWASLWLRDGDPRASAGTAPKCSRCGAFMAPVNPDVTPERSS